MIEINISVSIRHASLKTLDQTEVVMERGDTEPTSQDIQIDEPPQKDQTEVVIEKDDLRGSDDNLGICRQRGLDNFLNSGIWILNSGKH